MGGEMLGIREIAQNLGWVCYPILLPMGERVGYGCGGTMGRRSSSNGSFGVKGLHRKRGWFYFQPPTPKDGGVRPVAMALGTRDLVEAITLVEAKRGELEQWQAARRRTLDELLPMYYHEKREDSVKSKRQREMVLGSFSAVLGNPRIEEVTPERIDEWRGHVRMHGANPESGREEKAKNGKLKRPKLVTPRSDATLRTYTIVVKAFFNWAVERKWIQVSPVRRLKRQTLVVRTKVQDFLTDEEREKLLAEEMPDYLRFILMFGFFAGLRDGEMLAMKRSWIWIAKDGSGGTVTVQNQAVVCRDGKPWLWRPKKREMRTVPLHPRLIGFLEGYGMREPWMLRPDREFWPDPGTDGKRFDAHRAMAGLAKRAGVRKLNYHILRHSFGTSLVMKGVSLAEVAGLLGDTLKVTEENYAGYCPSRVNPLAVL